MGEIYLTIYIDKENFLGNKNYVVDYPALTQRLLFVTLYILIVFSDYTLPYKRVFASSNCSSRFIFINILAAALSFFAIKIN